MTRRPTISLSMGLWTGIIHSLIVLSIFAAAILSAKPGVGL